MIVDSQSSKSREIIVRLRNHNARLAFLKGRAVQRKKREKTYINEDLTQARTALAFQCRQLKRENKVQKTLVYNGNVNIIDNNGKKVKFSHIAELIWCPDHVMKYEYYHYSYTDYPKLDGNSINFKR